MAGQMARAHGLRLARAREFCLPLHRPQTLDHDEAHAALAGSTLDDAHDVRVDAGETPPVAIGQAHFRFIASAIEGTSFSAVRPMT
jgi:hypothetical protein